MPTLVVGMFAREVRRLAKQGAGREDADAKEGAAKDGGTPTTARPRPPQQERASDGDAAPPSTEVGGSPLPHEGASLGALGSNPRFRRGLLASLPPVP
jgi:hypothetical protein